MSQAEGVKVSSVGEHQITWTSTSYSQRGSSVLQAVGELCRGKWHLLTPSGKRSDCWFRAERLQAGVTHTREVSRNWDEYDGDFLCEVVASETERASLGEPT